MDKGYNNRQLKIAKADVSFGAYYANAAAWAIRLDYADLMEISDWAAEGVMFCTMKDIMV